MKKKKRRRRTEDVMARGGGCGWRKRGWYICLINIYVLRLNLSGLMDFLS